MLLFFCFFAVFGQPWGMPSREPSIITTHRIPSSPLWRLHRGASIAVQHQLPRGRWRLHRDKLRRLLNL
uniref:Putative secreted protein n=1 Tax=Anopheles marajoara TaxID=58244 RepID=A0A2M4CER4_9DIPT